jgi:hypothetical protein
VKISGSFVAVKKYKSGSQLNKRSNRLGKGFSKFPNPQFSPTTTVPPARYSGKDLKNCVAVPWKMPQLKEARSLSELRTLTSLLV